MKTIEKWKNATPAERRATLATVWGSVRSLATLLIAATFFVREVGKKG